ncbi:MAG: radical SAM protein [Candidatus Pacearchaeota archaeon]
MLNRYFSILKYKEKPNFILAKEKNILFKNIKVAKKIMENCEFCERKCGVNRFKESGFCKVLDKWKIFGAYEHTGEEKELVPSATLFLAGCPLRCCYCQNAPYSIEPEKGNDWSYRKVIEWINQMKKCKNINFVTPDCYVYNILKLLNRINIPIPIVWNSSSYYSEITAKLIKDIVDVYLLDFRYFNEDCAFKLSEIRNYPEVAKRNLLIASKNGELLIRVLILPNHIECCAKPILKWIFDNLGENIRVNIMNQYRPCFNAYKFPEINRNISYKEFNEVILYAKKIGLKNIV